MKNTDPFFLYVNDFLDRLRLELKSDKTISTYSDGLLAFKRYVEKREMDVRSFSFSHVDDEFIRGFLKDIVDSGKSLATRNLRLVSLKEYVRFCSEDSVSLVPTYIKVAKVKTKKVQPKQHNWITPEQVKILLDQPARNRTGIRDRFIMLMLFSTGMRLAELLGCRICDLHLVGTAPYAFVNGKGNKQRTIPLTKETVSNTEEYLRLFHKASSPEDFLIFTERDGSRHRMSEDNVQRIVSKYAKAAKEVAEDFPNLHPHMLRHSFGAILYRNNMSKAEIAKLLGHSQESTTEIYVETDVEMIRNSLKKITEDAEKDLFLSLSPESLKKLKTGK